MPNSDTETNDTKSEITRSQLDQLKLRLPTFWAKSPTAWFIQAEAQFSLARISSDISRYNHVLTSLPEDVIDSIIDYIQSPPQINIYEGIKTLLIERHSMSQERRIEQLLSNEQLGDRRPSEFFRSIKQLAGASGTISDKLLINLWTRRLPQAINIAIIAQGDKSDTELTILADRIWEASHRPTIAEANSVSEVSSLRAEIAQLKSMFEQFSNLNRSRSQQRGFSRQSRPARSNSQSNSRHDSNVCWYHRRFADEATKCTKPCSFQVSAKN